MFWRSYRVQPQGAAAAVTDAGNDSLLNNVGVALDEAPLYRTVSKSAVSSPTVTMTTTTTGSISTHSINEKKKNIEFIHTSHRPVEPVGQMAGSTQEAGK